MSALVLVCHPDLAASQANAVLAAAAHDVPGVTVHDLYGIYGDASLDIAAEQALVEAHDTIVFQFPLYWYSTPPLLKQWQDEVLTFEWAYDPMGEDGTGKALRDKTLACAVTTGAPVREYGPDGWNGYTVDEFLLPLRGTARFLEMSWRQPFLVYATFAMSDDQLAETAAAYQEWLVP